MNSECEEGKNWPISSQKMPKSRGNVLVQKSMDGNTAYFGPES